MELLTALKDTFITKFIPIWLSFQNETARKAFRWGDLINDGIGSGMRKQSVLEHEGSFTFFSATVSRMLDPYIFEKEGKHIDLLLLETSFRLHDHGERILGRDIISPKKTEQDDVDEYNAFIDAIKDLPDFVVDYYEKAFLLQFVMKNNIVVGYNNLFSERAENIMNNLYDGRYYEALIFSILEKFEYLFYPIEMIENHEFLLTWVLRKRIIGYQRAALVLPGFREVLFTHEVEKAFLNYLKEHEYVPERKN